MRRYESITIIDPDLSEEGCTVIIDKLKSLIDQHEGILIEIDDWGTKRLSYEIKKRPRGHYIRFDFCSKTEMINKMEYFFKTNDNILKFMTITLDEKANVTEIKKTLEESKTTTTKDDTESKDLKKDNEIQKIEPIAVNEEE